MRYYFHDNQSSPYTRYIISGVTLAALISIIGGINYSRGLPFSTNPFFGSTDNDATSESNDEAVERIFIPIRKEFPPDPFSGAVKTNDGSAHERAVPDVTVKRSDSIQPVVAKPPTAGLTGKQSSTIRTEQTETIDSEVRPELKTEKIKSAETLKQEKVEAAKAISEFTDVPEDIVESINEKPVLPLAAPVAASKPGAVTAAKNKNPVSNAVKPALNHSVQVQSMPVTRSKPVQQVVIPRRSPETYIKLAPRPEKMVKQSEPTRYRQLETVVEISDSGETVTGKRWKDVSNFSD